MDKQGVDRPVRVSIFSTGEEMQAAFDALMEMVRGIEGRPDNRYSEMVEDLLVFQQETIRGLVGWIRRLAILNVVFIAWSLFLMGIVVMR